MFRAKSSKMRLARLLPCGVRPPNETENAMKTVLFNDTLAAPVVSLILLDWNCRESFHALDYLARQDVPRDDYEIIWIEFYDRRADEIDRRIAAAEAKGDPLPVDNWIV